MTTTGDIARELANAITVYSGWRALDYLPAQPPAPCCVVMVDQIRYDEAFAMGNPVHRMAVTVIVRQVSDRSAQYALYEAVAPTGQRSIKAAIETDRTLGGVVDTLIVEESRNMRQVQIGEAAYLAVDFAVRVHP